MEFKKSVDAILKNSCWCVLGQGATKRSHGHQGHSAFHPPTQPSLWRMDSQLNLYQKNADKEFLGFPGSISNGEWNFLSTWHGHTWAYIVQGLWSFPDCSLTFPTDIQDMRAYFPIQVHLLNNPSADTIRTSIMVPRALQEQHEEAYSSSMMHIHVVVALLTAKWPSHWKAALQWVFLSPQLWRLPSAQKGMGSPEFFPPAFSNSASFLSHAFSSLNCSCLPHIHLPFCSSIFLSYLCIDLSFCPSLSYNGSDEKGMWNGEVKSEQWRGHSDCDVEQEAQPLACRSDLAYRVTSSGPLRFS